jgi:TonB family protein
MLLKPHHYVNSCKDLRHKPFCVQFHGMSRCHPLRYSVLVAIAGAVSALWPIAASAESDLDRHLNDEFKGKTLILRGFYSGDRLKYDASGSPVRPSPPDDWTISGMVRVEDFRVSGDHLRIDARRLHMGWLNGRFQDMHDQVSKPFKDEKADRSLRIEVDLGGAGTADSADKALAQIFLTSRDRFADLVPEYWKPCVRAALTGEGTKPYGKCSFPQDFAAIPGMSTKEEESPESEETTAGPPRERSFRAGRGVSPPKIIAQKDPEFSEPARRAKYQGNALLSIVVDETGQPQKIRIVQPLGMGLDRKAVEAVSNWRFNPGMKDGEPAAVEIAVEVNFHLY